MPKLLDVVAGQAVSRPPLAILRVTHPTDLQGPRLQPSASQPSRPELSLIPAGPFQMGSNDDSDAERPVHTVYVSSFFCARHVVTRRMFREFLANLADPGSDSADVVGLAPMELDEYKGRYCREVELYGQSDDHPAVYLSWYDAERYARWLSHRTGESFRLPTEAEWEKAARGGLIQSAFPWGDESAERMGANFGRPLAAGAERTRSVFELPQNGYGLFIGGNCWEWVGDWFDADYYATTSGARDPQGPLSGVFKVRRGGAYNNRQSFRLRVASRNRLEPHLRFPNMGVRLVRDLHPGERAALASSGGGRSAPAPVDPVNWSLVSEEWETAIRTGLAATDTLEARVEAVLDVLRPSMEVDHGGVVLESVEDGRAQLRMIGTCHRCPKSAMTFADIATTLRRYVPELSGIERIEAEPPRSC